MKIHDLKLNKQFADAVLSGEKSFELRNNDRGFQKGDKIRFTVVDEYGVEIVHELKKHIFEITYVLSDWGMKEGFVALAIKDIGGRT